MSKTIASSRNITAVVSDANLRRFLADLRREGFFVVQSSIVGNGTMVVYREDPR